MSTDLLGLGLPSLNSVRERLCGVEPYFFSKQVNVWRSLKSVAKVCHIEKQLVQELPCSSSALLRSSNHTSSLCVCSLLGVWQSEAGFVSRVCVLGAACSCLEIV